MITSTKIATLEQARSIVRQHVVAIKPFVNASSEADENIARVSDWLEQLSALSRVPPESSSFERYVQAIDTLNRLNHFLLLMNQQPDAEFANTPIGSVWLRAQSWCELAGQRHNHFTRDQVWELIAPAEPDALEDLGKNLFEAKWAAPVPAMDIEILRRTEGVEIDGDVTEPKDMPNGVALRFSVYREPARHAGARSGKL